MLLHDNSNIFFVSLQAVVSFHYKVKCKNFILCVKCISIMADSDKTLIGDGNLSNNNRHSSVPNFIPPCEVVHPDTHPTHVANSEPSTLKRKQTSFQITSVTVKGSRLSTDGGDDSADDLDESRTEDASSDILDCSRTTDVDNDQLSEDNSNTNNDDSSNLAPSIPVKCKPELPNKQDAQINATMKFPSETCKVEKPSEPLEKIENDHMVNPSALPDQWQHRFRVVKIVSSEPFKRGRWLCMDFMDPPAPAVEVKPEVCDPATVLNSQMIKSNFPDPVPTDRVAHIYEISPSDAYPGSISVAVGPDQNQQPMYGIFLPVNNIQYPLITGMYSRAIPLQKETKQEAPQSTTVSTTAVQQSQNYTPGQTVYADQPPVTCPQAQVMPTSSQQSQQSTSNVQVCTQHQSQTAVSAPTTTATTQPPASAPVIPVTTSNSVVITSQSPLPPQSQVTQDSQLTMQQRMQTSTVQSQSTLTSTQNVSSATTTKSTLISSSTQMSNVSQTFATSASSVQPQVHQITNMSTQPPIQQTSSVSSIQTQVQQITNVSPAQPQVQQITVSSAQSQVQQINASSVQSQGQQITNVPTVQSQVQQITNVPPVQSLVQPNTSAPSVQSQVQPITNISPVQSQVQSATNVTPVQSQVQSVTNLPPVQSQVQSVTNVTPVQSQVQSVTNVQTVQSQSQQLTNVPPVQPQVQSIPSVQSQAQSITNVPPVQSQVQPVQSQVQQINSVSSVPPQVVQLVNSLPPAPTQVQPATSMPSTLTSSIGTQVSSSANIPEISTTSTVQKEIVSVPSQVVQNHIQTQELGTPPQTSQEITSEATSIKSDINGEDSESVPSGTSTVAIDNKIEQAMDLVKSHLMFAVREEVDVLKEKITELVDRISQLEYENGFLRANASQQTLEQLNQSQLLQQQQQSQPPSVSINSFPQVTQSLPQQQINLQNQQSTS